MSLLSPSRSQTSSDTEYKAPAFFASFILPSNSHSLREVLPHRRSLARTPDRGPCLLQGVQGILASRASRFDVDPPEVSESEIAQFAPSVVAAHRPARTSPFPMSLLLQDRIQHPESHSCYLAHRHLQSLSGFWRNGTLSIQRRIEDPGESRPRSRSRPLPIQPGSPLGSPDSCGFGSCCRRGPCSARHVRPRMPSPGAFL